MNYSGRVIQWLLAVDQMKKATRRGWLPEYEALGLPGTEPLTEGRAGFFGNIPRMAADDLNMV